ncbi:MAG: glycosyltransferase [Actinobacteria bacterium]|nr:glycosyltransferase [Actinomycetota bacterium]
MTQPSLTSIVLPVHNQEDHVAAILRGYLAALGSLPGEYELVVVTNACTDASPRIVDELAEEDGRVRGVDLSEGGWGRAVKAGLASARGDLLCYTNAARTTPEILTLMLAYALAYPEVVLKANRRIRESRRRRLGSLLYNLEVRALFDLSVWDINGTPKIFPRRFDKLLGLRRDDDLIDAEFNVVCRRESYPVIEVPILSTERHGGRSTTGYRSAVRMYVGAFELRRELDG